MRVSLLEDGFKNWAGLAEYFSVAFEVLYIRGHTHTSKLLIYFW
jgi:hypothetical protein